MPLLFSACKKSGTSETPVKETSNTKLLGKWYYTRTTTEVLNSKGVRIDFSIGDFTFPRMNYFRFDADNTGRSYDILGDWLFTYKTTPTTVELFYKHLPNDKFLFTIKSVTDTELQLRMKIQDATEKRIYNFWMIK